jgi:hypothetical protein
LIQQTQAQNKKGFRSLKPSRETIFEIDYCAAVVSAAVVSTAVVSTIAGASTAVVSAAAASSFLPPQATIATAKPQTISDAIIFFIVYRLFELGAKIQRSLNFELIDPIIIRELLEKSD